MKRTYKDNQLDDVVYFVGQEIEKTSAFRQWTLFKVGERPIEEILHYVKIGNEHTKKPITHIYFTANHSWDEIENWNVVEDIIRAGFYVTVEAPIELLNKISDQLPLKNRKLIIMISYPVPEIKRFNFGNTYIKIDDEDFERSNSGVWVHNMKELTLREKYTPFKRYGKDIVLARKKDLSL